MKNAALELEYLLEEQDRSVKAHKKIAAEASEVYSPAEWSLYLSGV